MAATTIPGAHEHGGSRKGVIEGLAAQGKSNAQIAKLMNVSMTYVDNITRVWRHAMRRPEPEHDTGHADRDIKHAEKCMAAGGFVAAVRRNGMTYWIHPQANQSRVDECAIAVDNLYAAE